MSATNARPDSNSTRRQLLLAGGVALGGGLLGAIGCSEGRSSGSAEDSAPQTASGPRRRVLRFAHMTDIHVQPERRAPQGMAACLKDAMSLKDRPGLIVTGGDLIMDAFEAGRARSQEQWDLFHSVLRDESGVPAVHTIGNHDVWGWKRSKSGCTGSEPGYGKAWYCEMMSLSKPYHSHSRDGWHFIHLDSITQHGEGYAGGLDDEQFEWLTADLKTHAAQPTVVISHIPIFGACGQVWTKDEQTKRRWEQGGGLMHLDARRIMKLFLENRQVKLCLSGHLHLNERVDFNGVTYICDGAVCGRWWRGKHEQTVEGYGLIDLFSDGGFEYHYRTYGWQAAADPQGAAAAWPFDLRLPGLATA
ncbi:MAG: metallophosphoesterase [Planctomycetia bacterium]|nr:MAG: metallophosphoesterase [Planctomycetia bacterium]